MGVAALLLSGCASTTDDGSATAGTASSTPASPASPIGRWEWSDDTRATYSLTIEDLYGQLTGSLRAERLAEPSLTQPDDGHTGNFSFRKLFDLPLADLTVEKSAITFSYLFQGQVWMYQGSIAAKTIQGTVTTKTAPVAAAASQPAAEKDVYWKTSPPLKVNETPTATSKWRAKRVK